MTIPFFSVEVFILETSENFTWLYNEASTIPVYVLEDCEIAMNVIFDDVL